MPNVLIATDADEVHDEVDAALADDDTTVIRVRRGRDVLGAIRDHEPDLVILDLQIGNMGGVATALDLRLEEGADRLGPQRILMLLDRLDDSFIAKRAGADGWMLKPIDAVRLRRAAAQVLSGAGFHEVA